LQNSAAQNKQGIDTSDLKNFQNNDYSNKEYNGTFHKMGISIEAKETIENTIFILNSKNIYRWDSREIVELKKENITSLFIIKNPDSKYCVKNIILITTKQ